MGRSVEKKKRKGSVSSRAVNSPGKKIAKKRKKDGEKERTRWEESIPKRKGFTCERQIKESTLEGAHYIELIKSRGLIHLFKPVKGYVVEWVTEFYKNMEIDEETQQIKSKVATKIVTITPDDIAMYLEYQRPHHSKISYPDNFTLSPESVRDILFVDYNRNHGSGGLKDNYRTMNKVLYCNLLPRGKEKLPQHFQLQFLYVFMRQSMTIDFALWIYSELVKFRTDTKMVRNFPFPAMITYFCLQVGLKLSTTYKYTKCPGPIDAGSENKSKAVVENQSKRNTQSRTQAGPFAQTDAPCSSAPKQTGAQRKSMKMLKSVLCRAVEIQQDQKRLKLIMCKIAEKVGVEIDEEDEGRWDGRAIGDHISPESSEGGVSLTEEDIDPGMFRRDDV